MQNGLFRCPSMKGANQSRQRLDLVTKTEVHEQDALKLSQVSVHSLHHLQDLRQLRGLKPVHAHRPMSATGHTPPLKDNKSIDKAADSAKIPGNEEGAPEAALAGALRVDDILLAARSTT